jgi:hypothetical protein
VTKEVLQAALIRGETKSCGCWNIEQIKKRLTTHSMSQSDEYNIWTQMKRRCHNPTAPSYADYGAKGISVYDEWRESFAAFFQYVGPRPSRAYSLDRFPNREGNYEPGNVRWATMEQQANNRSTNVFITRGEITATLSEWADILGMDKHVLHDRIRSYGWSVERAFTEPVRKVERDGNILIKRGAETKTLRGWSKTTGINYWTLLSRYHRSGKRGEDLFSTIGDSHA